LRGSTSTCSLQTNGGQEGGHRGLVEVGRLSAAKAGWQRHQSIANSNETTDRAANGLKHATDFSVASLANDHLVPAVCTLPAGGFDLIELGRWLAISQVNPRAKLLELLVFQLTKDSNGILPLDLISGMHEPIGQLTRGGEQEQTLGVDVQTANGDPTPKLHGRQFFEYGDAMLGV
jgi:hypothetical protein